MRALWPLIAAVFLPVSALAAGVTGSFANIDGGTHRVEDWRGRPVLLVNTASQCGYTHQYSDLQRLYDRYRDAGLVVLAVPSDDFRQELGSAEEVKEFCDMHFGLDLPMTDITHVRGRKADEVYRAIRAATGFVPKWNFNKVLLDGEGEVVASWGAVVAPEAPAITRRIEELLAN